MALELIPLKNVEQKLGLAKRFNFVKFASLICKFAKFVSPEGLFSHWSESWTTGQHYAYRLRVGDTRPSLSPRFGRNTSKHSSMALRPSCTTSIFFSHG